MNALIVDCYRTFLLREPSSEEVAHWGSLLSKRFVSPARLPEHFRASREFLDLQTKLQSSKVGLLHIPKCAGTSVRDWLSPLYEEGRIFVDGITQPDRLRHARLLSGHFELGFLTHQECTHVLTVLRDPVERIASLYRFARSAGSYWPADDPVRHLSFEDWLNCPDPRARDHFDNYYLRAVTTPDERKIAGPDATVLGKLALERYSCFAAVGTTENMAAFFKKAASALGIRPPVSIPKANTARGNRISDPSYPPRPEMTPAVLRALDELTLHDRVIYEYFRLQQEGMDSAVAVPDASLFGGSVEAAVSAEVTMSPESVPLVLRVRNDSWRVWSIHGPEKVQIAYHWLDTDYNIVSFDAGRVPLGRADLPPGEKTEIQCAISTAGRRGAHRLIFTLVQGADVWFDADEGFSPGLLALED